MADMLGLDRIFATLGTDPGPGLTLVEAVSLSGLHYPPFGPDLPAILLGPLAAGGAELQRLLLIQYPPEHALKALTGSEPDLTVRALELSELEQLKVEPPLVALLVAPLPTSSSFESLQETVARLRAPDGCPWDREQTHRSLRKHLLEEAYEALEALDSDDTIGLEEELGDLLLQVLLQAQIAFEAGSFRASDVVAGIQAKLIRRHPHVFGDLELSDVDQVLKNWEHFKEAEKGNGVLDGVPRSLPALEQADELQGRAARVGFDWPQNDGVLEKVAEEAAELQDARDDGERERELGDLLFALVNLARWLKIDPEAALRQTNQRFRRRFDRMLGTARQAGQQLDQLGIAELELLWEAAKRELN